MLLTHALGGRQSIAKKPLERCDRGIARGGVNGFSGNRQSHNDAFFWFQDRSYAIGSSGAHPHVGGWCNRLAKSVALNSVFVPLDSAPGFLLWSREAILNFERPL